MAKKNIENNLADFQNEPSLKWYMKQNHGRIHIKGKTVVGIEYVTEKGKKPVMVHIPLADEDVALFDEAQKAQYLEQR